MITVEEAKKRFAKGEFVAGMRPATNFTIGVKTDRGSKKNVYFITEINKLLNSKLDIKNYSSNLINYYTTTFLIYPHYNGKGVNWQERKYFKRKEKKFFIDVRFPDYERFCNADKKEALQIMAEQTLRGTKKYLSKVKGFEFEKFYNDMKQLFIKEGII